MQDSFFELGGDSIRSVLLVGTLRDAGIRAEVRDVLERPVFQDFCAGLLTDDGSLPEPDPGQAAVASTEPFSLISAAERALLPDGLDDAYPLTRSQLGMHLEMLAGAERPAYHLVKSMRVRDERPFAPDVFQRAVDLLVAAHDVLRTGVDLGTYERPLQLVRSSVALTVEVTDLRGVTAEEADRLVRDHVDGLARRALDRDACPLLRLDVRLCGDGSWQLTVAYAHVILDGWSLQRLLSELMGLYHGLLDGQVPPSAPTAVRFADTVAAELAALESAGTRDFWRGLVAGRSPVRLPADWSAAGEAAEDRTEQGQRVEDDGPRVLSVPFADIEDGLRRLAARAQAPLKSVLFAAHLTVLSRLTPEDDFLSGLTHHVRPESADADRIHGMFLNVLPFPFRRGARSHTELVAGVFAREREVWGHRHFPMPAIQQEFGNGERLLEVYFSHQDFGSAEELGQRTGVEVDAAAGAGAGHNEFGFSVASAPGRLQLRCGSRSLGESSARRLAALYRSVLEAMAEDPEGDPRFYTLPAEEQATLDRWADAVEGALSVVPVPVTWSRIAARTPHATAVEGHDFTLTFHDIETRANQLAHHLTTTTGAGPGHIIGVLLDRGPHIHTTLLAIWKTGAAYLPLDPTNPPNRTTTTLNDAGAHTLITQTTHTHNTTAYNHIPHLIHLDNPHTQTTLTTQPTTPPTTTIHPQTPAYLIYTSGSTGRPKGVTIPHQGLANHLTWATRDLVNQGTTNHPTHNPTGTAVFTSLAFDLVIPNIWAPLLTGQRVVMLPQHLDLSQLAHHLNQHAPYAYLKLTPAHLEILTQQLTPTQATHLAGTIVTAGEPLPPTLAHHWTQLLGPNRLINEYGPTETSIGTTTHTIPTHPNTRPTTPIGTPLPGTQTHILDTHLNPVPTGTTGELFITGTGTAHGYHNQPAHTAHTFLPNPHGQPGTRLYRTGDLARHLPGGTIEFLGRTDHQIKIRGHRIETGEVSSVLLEHDQVREAFVIGHEHAPGDVRLAAYLVPADPAGPPTAAELGAHCAELLPEYMVPAGFTVLDALPLNANGKVDRKALPVPEWDTGAEHFEPPVTGTEQRLARIWAEVLGVERIGRGDGFSARGGHSLLVIRAVAAAQREQLPMTLFQLYQYETLERVAAAVDTALAEAAPAAEAGNGQETRNARDPRGGERPVSALSWWTAGRLPEADRVRDLLAEHRVPGIALAVIHDGELVAAEGYGTADGTRPVRAGTPFHVGSLSKHITALGVLRLVDRGVLDLDADADSYLTDWRIPGGPGLPPVTVRHLLGHQSGLSATPGLGFPPGPKVPSTLDLLTGRAVPEVPEVTREGVPGTQFRKANVHYVVLQRILEDVTGEPFAELMRSLVLDPLGMRDSSFDQAYPERLSGTVAVGHDADGGPLGRRVRPDAAAAGLWSTAVDLAKAALEVRRSALGRPGALLERATAGAMLTPSPLSLYGLGTVVDVTETETEFGHAGTPVGFHGLSAARLRARTGFVALTNGDSGARVVKALTEFRGAV
ncbi:non-ribosomal peptide synthetase [Streptomyces clavuligerus]|nr:non-ribosomal peptide synthetase [Streptomyces clavuligerus]ANW17659.1 hypothetical protein BB341_05165 [Streptomyces clavuligerus]